MSKAASHQVTPSTSGFVVVSGTSGASYLVIPLAMGGAVCTCKAGRESSAVASTCSHVEAVNAFVVRFNAERREAAAKDAAMVRCWLCDGAGQVEIRPVYQSLGSSGTATAYRARVERCENCGGLGYVKRGE